jgi:diguanylate cyclase (GGDEF)-like protein
MSESATRILLFSNDHQFINEIEHRLDSFGFQLTVCDSVETLQTHEFNQYKCILADISSNTFQSTHLFGEINQAENNLPPLFYISNEDTVESRIEAVQANGQGFFVKRRDNEHLYELLFNLGNIEHQDKHRVLIFDDDKSQTIHINTVLQKQKLQTKFTNNHLELLSLIRTFNPELIVVNLNVSMVSGLEIIALLKQINEVKNVSIVGLAKAEQPKLINQAYCRGCDVVITSPFEYAALARICEAKVQKARIRNFAQSKDAMTSLMSHAQILQHLEKDLMRSKRTKSPMAIALVDIDQFKLVNDTYGHMYGDLIIKNLSKLLSVRVRNSDVVGRYGGEEFLVLLYDCDLENAFNILDDIRCRFELMSHALNEHSLQCTFSAGIACFPENENVNQIIKSADAALYEAKTRGRNRVLLSHK